MEFFRGFGWDLAIAEAHQRQHRANVADAAARARNDWIGRLVPGMDAEVDQRLLSLLYHPRIREDFREYFFFLYKPEYAISQVRSNRLVRTRNPKKVRRELPDLLGSGGLAVYCCNPFQTHAKWTEADFDNLLVYRLFSVWTEPDQKVGLKLFPEPLDEIQKKLFSMVDWFKDEISPHRWKSSFFPDVLGLRWEHATFALAAAKDVSPDPNNELSVQKTTNLEPVASITVAYDQPSVPFRAVQNDTTSPRTTATNQSSDVTTAAPETVGLLPSKLSNFAGLVSGLSVNEMEIDGPFGPIGDQIPNLPSFTGSGPVESGVEQLPEPGTGVAEPEGSEALAPLLDHSGNPSLNDFAGTENQSNAPTTQVSNTSERDRQPSNPLCVEAREQPVRATAADASPLKPELINPAVDQTSKQSQGDPHPTHDHEPALDPHPAPRFDEYLNREAAAEPNNSNERVSLFGDGSLLQSPALDDQALPRYRLRPTQSDEYVTAADSLSGTKAAESDGSPQSGTFDSESVEPQLAFESTEHEDVASLIPSGSPSLTPPPRCKLPEREGISGAFGTAPTADDPIRPESRRISSTHHKSNANGPLETVPEARPAPRATTQALAQTQLDSPTGSPQAKPSSRAREPNEMAETALADSPQPKEKRAVKDPGHSPGTLPSRAIRSTSESAGTTSRAPSTTPVSAQVKQVDSQEKPQTDKNIARKAEAKRKRPAPTPAGAAAKRRSPARSKPQQDNEDSLFFPAPEDEVRESTPDVERSPSPVPERRKSARNAQRAATAKAKASAAKTPQPKRTPAKQNVAAVKKGPKRTGKPKS